MACAVFVLASILAPVTAIAADGGEAPSVAVADERIAWARAQEDVETHVLESEQGGSTQGCVRYFQHFDSGYTGVERTFEYRLVAIDDGAPMPAGAQDGLFAWTFTGDDDGWVNIECADVEVSGSAQVFSYLAYQHIEEQKPGYTYDGNVYLVQVHVLANTNEAFAVVYDSIYATEKLDDPGWTIHYEKPAGDSSETHGGDSAGRSSSAGANGGTYASSYVPSERAGKLAQTYDSSVFVLPILASAALSCALAAALRNPEGGERHV